MILIKGRLLGMNDIRYETAEEIMNKAREADGLTFREIDKHDRLAKSTKGVFGHTIEESLFGYEINSDPEADFAEAGIELKVTPVKKLKNGNLSSKERLVLNIIDYMEEINLTFETSSFLNKNETILLMFYLWDENLDFRDYTVLGSHLMEHSEADLLIFEQDWKIIVDKIRAGKAHEISESDTMYLSACTKGASSKSVRQQPFSDIPAKQRAFSFKNSYMTALVRSIFTDEEIPSIIDSPKKSSSFEEILDEKFSPFYGKTFSEICQKLNVEINPKTKNKHQILMSAILGIIGTSLGDISEFSKANIKIKTIRLNKKGTPRESMSFPTFKFMDLIEEEWETSTLRTMFEEEKYLFIVFQENESGEDVFKQVKLWNMPNSILDNEVKAVWEDTVTKIREGIEFENKNGRLYNNLPSSKFNGVCHIRPHARDAADTYPLPDGREMTKQCFWLNAGFIKEIVGD